jgi:hypothetical protein
MVDLIKVYRQNVPAMRFIGRKYGDQDRVNEGFAALWDEWFEKKWFDAIERQINTSTKETYEDGDAYCGLMRWKEGEPFEYWIGIFMPEDSVAPEGFGSVRFPPGVLGVCWVFGNEGELYGQESRCAKKLTEMGYEILPDEAGAWWFFERYACPRFTTPDDLGNRTLDVCHYIK